MSGWTWRYHAADGTDLTPVGLTPPGGDLDDPIGAPPSSSAATGSAATPGAPTANPGFPSQADAETWVGESWRDLLEAGVDSVSLLRDGEQVYGPMSLRPME